MKKIILSGLLTTLCMVTYSQEEDPGNSVQLSSNTALKISGITVNTDNVGIYEKFEITFSLAGEWDNPFDPDQIRVDADIEMPDGNVVTIPGFFYQGYYRNHEKNLEKAGDPVWKIRFSPALTGTYQYQVIIDNKGKEIKTPRETFNCESFNANHGFLRISENNPLYFEFSDGTPFFGVSMGRIAADAGGFYNRFAKAGGNFNRLFLTNGNFDIQELTRDPGRSDRGLGKINLENSWNLDKLLEKGEELGIYHMLTLTNQYNFNRLWDIHTYNKANGGILNSKNEYFVNEEAMQYFEKYLRYLIARWGYSTSVFSWDLWNEYSAMGIDVDIAIPWHKRMARYIESIDVYDHVIHTNDGAFNGNDKMHALPEMELVSTNTYAIKDISHLVSVWTKRMIDTFNKPYVLTEFGMGHNFPEGCYGRMDPERRMVHNGLWSPLMSGSAATGLAWECNWLNHRIFFTYIKAVHEIVHDVPFSKRAWKPVDIYSFEFSDPQPSYYSDVIVEGWPGNFRMDRNDNPEYFRIDKNGRVENQESLRALLTGSSEENSRNSTSNVTFKMDFPEKGEFVVYVTELRDTEPTPQLTVKLDGKQVITRDLTPLEGDDYHPIMYNQYYSAEVPEGSHTITIANTGGGRIITAFELKNYVLRNSPDIDVRGIQSNDNILLWLKNRKFTVLHEMVNIPLQQQVEGILELQNVPDGKWIAEWVNTINATQIKTELLESSENKLVLKTPMIRESVAVRLHKL